MGSGVGNSNNAFTFPSLSGGLTPVSLPTYTSPLGTPASNILNSNFYTVTNSDLAAISPGVSTSIAALSSGSFASPDAGTSTQALTGSQTGPTTPSLTYSQGLQFMGQPVPDAPVGQHFVGTNSAGAWVYAYDDTTTPDGADGATAVQEVVVTANRHDSSALSLFGQYKSSGILPPAEAPRPIRWKNLNAPILPRSQYDLNRINTSVTLFGPGVTLNYDQQIKYFKNTILNTEYSAKSELPVAIQAIQQLITERQSIINSGQPLSAASQAVDDLIVKYYHDDGEDTINTILIEANLIQNKLKSGITYSVDPTVGDNAVTNPLDSAHTTIGSGFFNSNDVERDNYLARNWAHVGNMIK